MATMGSQPSSWSGWESYMDSKVQCGIDATVPVGMNQLVGLHAYIAREGGSSSITLAAWRGNTIIASLSAIANSAVNSSPGGQSWCGGAIAPVAITPGETLRLGWQRGAAAFWDWSWASGGSHYEQDTAGAWAGATGTGLIGMYADVQAAAAAAHPSLQINGAWALADARFRLNNTAARLLMNGSVAQR